MGSFRLLMNKAMNAKYAALQEGIRIAEIEANQAERSNKEKLKALVRQASADKFGGPVDDVFFMSDENPEKARLVRLKKEIETTSAQHILNAEKKKKVWVEGELANKEKQQALLTNIEKRNADLREKKAMDDLTEEYGGDGDDTGGAGKQSWWGKTMPTWMGGDPEVKMPEVPKAMQPGTRESSDITYDTPAEAMAAATKAGLLKVGGGGASFVKQEDGGYKVRPSAPGALKLLDEYGAPNQNAVNPISPKQDAHAGDQPPDAAAAMQALANADDGANKSLGVNVHNIEELISSTEKNFAKFGASGGADTESMKKAVNSSKQAIKLMAPALGKGLDTMMSKFDQSAMKYSAMTEEEYVADTEKVFAKLAKSDPKLAEERKAEIIKKYGSIGGSQQVWKDYMTERKTQKLGTLPGQTSFTSYMNKTVEDAEIGGFPAAIQKIITKGPLNDKTSKQLYAEMGQKVDYSDREFAPTKDRWAASAVATQKRKGETDIQAYQRIREEKRQRLLKIGVGDTSDPDMIMNAGMTVEQETAFESMSDEQKHTFQDLMARKQGFKDSNDLMEQVSSVGMGSMAANMDFTAGDTSRITQRGEFLHKNPSAETREDAIMDASRKQFQSLNQGYNVGKIRSAPAQKILDAVEAERSARMASDERKFNPMAEASGVINAPQIQTDNSVHNTHMGRTKSTSNDPRMQNRRMAN